MRYLLLPAVFFISFHSESQPSSITTQAQVKAIPATVKVEKEDATRTTVTYTSKQLKDFLQKAENENETLIKENDLLKRKLLAIQLNNYFSQQQSALLQHPAKRQLVPRNTDVLDEHDYVFDY
jgi:hypothetical protein